jgi:hypothetical protein
VELCVAYLVVADEEFGRQIPFAFLERVKEDFKRRYQGGRADLAVAHSLDKEFGCENLFLRSCRSIKPLVSVLNWLPVGH